MKEYHKIQSIFNRDPNNHFKTFLEDQYSTPEIRYLAENRWVATEQIDGTNIRVIWDCETVKFRGKTDRVDIPLFLLTKLNEMFPVELLRERYPEQPMCLYGEGFGAKIQKGGGNYISDGVSFILFDVLIDGWWLLRNDLDDIARKLDIMVVPIVFNGITLPHIVAETKKKRINSIFGDFLSEGFVLKPRVGLKTRDGHRIITKIKHKDFPHELGLTKGD